MPRYPPHPCNWPGCPELATRRFCASHARLYDSSRGSAPERGYDAEHRAWRAQVLARDSLCPGLYNRHPEGALVATVADHILPVRQGGTWELDNGQGLCAGCHGAKIVREQRQR